jgi:hypothetical protein
MSHRKLEIVIIKVKRNVIPERKIKWEQHQILEFD